MKDLDKRLTEVAADFILRVGRISADVDDHIGVLSSLMASYAFSAHFHHGVDTKEFTKSLFGKYADLLNFCCDNSERIREAADKLGIIK
jgi:hypothetical protein